MSLEGLTRVLSALAGAPPGEDSLKRKHMTRSVETSPRPDTEMVTTQPGSPQSQSPLGPREPSGSTGDVRNDCPSSIVRDPDSEKSIFHSRCATLEGGFGHGPVR